MEIHIAESTRETMEKYTKVGPTRMGPLVERIIRQWCWMAYKFWKKNPKLIPILPKIPETRTVSIKLDHAIGKDYIRLIMDLNRREADLDPVSLTTWLCERFMDVYKMKEKLKYKSDFGHLKKF